MKSESGESPQLLRTGPESAEIYDLLYADRARISALYAQLFPQGILTSVKTTAQQSFSDDSNVGTDVKILKAEAKSTDSGSEGIEHLFDASWSIPLEVLARLKSLSLVRQSLNGAGLGSVILTDCHMRIVDFASMNNLWEPGMRMFVAAGQQGAEKGPIADSRLTRTQGHDGKAIGLGWYHPAHDLPEYQRVATERPSRLIFPFHRALLTPPPPLDGAFPTAPYC